MMGRKITVTCNICGKEIEKVHSKLYLAPVLPGKSMVSFMASYSHYADVCSECVGKLIPKMIKRQPRVNNGINKPKVKKQ